MTEASIVPVRVALLVASTVFFVLRKFTETKDLNFTEMKTQRRLDTFT